MLAGEKLIGACNEQVGHEFGASNQYVSIAAYFDGQSLDKLARFFHAQAEEEREHAMKFVNFIVASDGLLAIPEIPAPRTAFTSAAECVALALEHEKTVTRQIYGLVDIAKEDSNYMALRFLDWFVEEQFEEITTMSTLLDVVKRAGEENLLSVEEFLARGGLAEEETGGPQ